MYCLSGLLIALAVCAHSVVIVPCICYIFYIFYSNKRKFIKLPMVIYYMITGLVTAIAIVINLFIISEGRLFNNILSLLNYNYFKLEGVTLQSQISTLFTFLEKSALLWILIIMFAFILSFILYKKINIKKSMSIVIPFGVLISLIFNFNQYYLKLINTDNTTLTNYVIVSVALLIPIYLITFRTHGAKMKRLVWLFYIPFILQLISISLLSHSSVSSRMYYCVVCFSLFFIFNYYSELDNISKNDKNSNIFKKLNYIVTSIILALVFFVNYYTLYWNVYRDVNYSESTYIINSGVYKGLSTTEERGKALENLEKSLQENVRG